MRCKNCDHVLRFIPANNICPHCGKEAADPRCKNCRHVLPFRPVNNICPHCGKEALDPLPPPPKMTCPNCGSSNLSKRDNWYLCHQCGAEIEVTGIVRHATDNNVGCEFNTPIKNRKALEQYLMP